MYSASGIVLIMLNFSIKFNIINKINSVLLNRRDKFQCLLKNILRQAYLAS